LYENRLKSQLESKSPLNLDFNSLRKPKL
jgi:hypothetical protein